MRYYRRVIHISAEDSPNVALGLFERANGREPSNRLVIEGVLPFDVYEQRRATWDPIRQCIGLDGRFWEGAEVLMYPPHWLNRAEEIARLLDLDQRIGRRTAKGVGVDTGEGVADTVWTAVDERGVIDQESHKTPNTARIKWETIDFLRKWNCPAERCCFDKGGGGLQVADDLREIGWNVRTVAFGESVTIDPQRHKQSFKQRVEVKDERYTYLNRRAQMAHALRILLEPPDDAGGQANSSVDPRSNGEPFSPFSRQPESSAFSQRAREGVFVGSGFGIPARFVELRRQMAPIPLLYDGEGRIWLPPKNRKEGESKEKKTLIDVLGCSPDEWDSLMLAVFAMQSRAARATAGAL